MIECTLTYSISLSCQPKHARTLPFVLFCLNRWFQIANLIIKLLRNFKENGIKFSNSTCRKMDSLKSTQQYHKLKHKIHPATTWIFNNNENDSNVCVCSRSLVPSPKVESNVNSLDRKWDKHANRKICNLILRAVNFWWFFLLKKTFLFLSFHLLT